MIKDGTIKYQEIWNEKLPDMSDISDVLLFRKAHRSDDDYAEELSKWFVWQNMMTGEESRSSYKVIRHKQRNIYVKMTEDDSSATAIKTAIPGHYLTYNEKFDVLVMYLGEYRPSDAVKGEIRGWENIRPAFVIERNGSLYGMDEKYVKGNYVPYVYDMRTEVIPVGDEFLMEVDCFGDISEGDVLKLHTGTNAVIKKFFGNAIPRVGRLIKKYFKAVDVMKPLETIEYANDSADAISKMREQMQPEEKGISAMKEYLSYELPEVDKNIFLPIFLDKTKRKSAENKILFYMSYDMSGTILQKISGDLSVLRTFVVYAPLKSDDVDEDVTADDLEVAEVKRIYLDGFKRPVACDCLFGKWTYCSEPEAVSSIEEDLLFFWEPEDSKGTALSFFDDYAKEMLEGTRAPENTANDVYKITRNIISFAFCPFAQSLMSSPFENIKKAILALTERGYTMDVTFEKMFGVDRILYYKMEFGSNLLDAMKCPAHMVKTLDKTIGKTLDEGNVSYTGLRYICQCFARIKDLFYESYPYFRNMNSEQFEELVNIYVDSANNVEGSQSRSMFSPIRDSIKCLISIYGPNNINAYMNYMFKEIFDIAEKSGENVCKTLVMYYDFMAMCAHLLDIDEDFKKPKWKLKRVEDIKRCHDEISFICNMKTSEEEMKKYTEGFDAVKNNWKDLLYAEKEFSVIAPNTPMDIANEGICLQHCVKSYLENAIEGKTNILFIRKTDDITKPFYTLEVKKNRIRQCHGFGNCNVSETDGLQEFLERYCKEKHIKLEDTDKVLAAG